MVIIAGFESAGLDADTVREMLLVGAVPTPQPMVAGTAVNLGGHPVVVTGEITRDQFMARVAAAGLQPHEFRGLSPNMHFYTITTD